MNLDFTFGDVSDSRPCQPMGPHAFSDVCAIFPDDVYELGDITEVDFGMLMAVGALLLVVTFGGLGGDYGREAV